MPKGYFRELRQYTAKDISDYLGISNESIAKDLIGKLLKSSILKAVSCSKDEYDRIDDFDEYIGDAVSNTGVSYVFNYVGIVIIDGYVIKCFPKYIRLSDEPEKEFKTVLRVLQKVSLDNPVLDLTGGGDVSPQDAISLRLYILNEFFQRGFYLNEREFSEDNGEGEILWEETLEEQSYLVGNSIIHAPLKTLLVEDDEDYFTNLHKCVLSQISREFEANGMNSLFDLVPLYFTPVLLSDFDSVDHILYMLDREEREQYVTWKRSLLKALRAYVAITNTEKAVGRFEIYGTNVFHRIWENVCKKIFTDCLYLPLKSLPVVLSKLPLHSKDSLLIDIIEKPLWYSARHHVSVKAQGTFEPDLIGIYPSENHDKYEFWIFDAKYYYYSFQKKKNSNDYYISGQPGVEDVAKQYMYEVVFRKFVNDQGYVMAHNIFLTPTEEQTYYFGHVSIDVLERFNDDRLKTIEVVKINAEDAYRLYLNGDKAYSIINSFRSFNSLFN